MRLRYFVRDIFKAYNNNSIKYKIYNSFGLFWLLATVTASKNNESKMYIRLKKTL